MVKKIIFPLIAITGIAFCIFSIYRGMRPPPVIKVPFPPPMSPYKHYVAGEGIIESAYKNISVSVPFTELVSDIYVKVGDIVTKETPLFKLDTKHLEAQLLQAKQDVLVAQVDYENKKRQFSFYQKLKKKSAVSQQAYTLAFYDKELAKQKLNATKTIVHVIKTDLTRSIIRAPINGEVLQVNIRVGQSANINPFDKLPLIYFGDTNVYHLRINVDEEDAWRVIKGAPATAFIRGNSKFAIPLTYVYSEPYIIPKVSFSDSSTERVDTRVLQLIYQFPKNKYPIYAGQLLDVFLEAKPHGI
jgi:biotin carboxyl carrier protein